MSPQPSAAPPLRAIRCTIGLQSYCVDATAVQSLQRADVLRRSPQPDGQLGWLLASGERIPVYALSALLYGRDPGPEEALHAIVVLGVAPGRRIGIAVERVSRVFQVSR